MRKEYEETGARTTAALMDEYIKSAHEARSYKQALLMLVEGGAKTTPGPRSRTDLALVIGLLAIFAGGLFAGYTELVSINRELGAAATFDDEVERRLTRLEEGQSAIQTALAGISARLDAIDARLGTLDQAIRGIQERASLEP